MSWPRPGPLRELVEWEHIGDFRAFGTNSRADASSLNLHVSRGSEEVLVLVGSEKKTKKIPLVLDVLVLEEVGRNCHLDAVALAVVAVALLEPVQLRSRGH